MANPFLTNDALKKFVERLKINKETKSLLISKIPQMDKEERISLLKVLVDIYFLDLEEKRAIEKLRKLWKK